MKLYASVKLLIPLLMLSTLATQPLTSLAQDSVYSFGVVPQFTAKKTREIWLPILAELEKRTGLKIELSSSATIPAFETQVFVGEFDFAYMNPYIAYKAGERKHYTPLVRDIANALHGIIVVKKESKISSVQALEGKLVAFPAPNALGASLVIKAALSDEFNIQVLPKYVQTHSSVYLNVALGRVIAGSGVQKTLSRQDERVRNQLRVLYKTNAVPPHPIGAHKRVSLEKQARVKEALLAMAETKSGRALLRNIPIAKLGEAKAEEYRALKKLNLDRFYVTD